MSKLQEVNEKEIPAKVLALYKAVEEILEAGVDAASLKVSDITEKAGIGKGTAYEYFSSKEELIAEANAYAFKKAVGQIKQGLMEQENLDGQLEFLFQVAEQNTPNKKSVMNYVHVVTGNSDLSKMIHKKMCCNDGKSDIFSMILADMISKNKSENLFNKEIPDEVIMYSLVSRLLTYMFLLRGKTNPISEENASLFKINAKQEILREFGV